MDTSASEMEILTQGNLAFAIDLYQELSDTHENFFYSPYSLSSALAMTYAGARGSTELEIADILYFVLSQERLHPTWSALENTLTTRDRIDTPSGEVEGFVLHIANSIWAQDEHEFLEPFVGILGQHYGAEVKRVDFINQSEEARLIINHWISEQTQDKIKDIVPPGIVDSLTRLVLANAIYFNAAWMIPFEESNTEIGLFNLPDGSQVQVPFMIRQGSFQYMIGEDYQIVELPYVGGQIVMDILIPDQGAFQDFESTLDSIWLREALASLGPAEVRLSMPKFEIASEFQLSQPLIQMGMQNAFGDEADFSGMDGTLELYLKDILHKSYVKVDEAGTEAAAATAVIVAAKAMPTGVIELSLNRPFIFLIRDLPTGATIFMGRILNPSNE